MLTVTDLIKQLKKLPQDLPVVIQIDSEGNGYHFLSGVDDDAYYRGEYELEVSTKEDLEYKLEGFEDCEPEVLPQCVVLW